MGEREREREKTTETEWNGNINKKILIHYRQKDGEKKAAYIINT